MEKNLMEIFNKFEGCDEQPTDISQRVRVTHNGVAGDFKVDIDCGGNITDVTPFFEVVPYLENGKKTYDRDYLILEQAFNNWYGVLNDLLYECDIGESFSYVITFREQISDNFGSSYTNEEEVELEYTLTDIDYNVE